MKQHIILLILLAKICTTLDARIGCRDNSYNLERPVDYKNWHVVDCNCVCEKAYKIFEGGICSHCQHRLTDIPINAHTQIVDEQKIVASVNIAALRKKVKHKRSTP